jgi:hypothetical protein
MMIRNVNTGAFELYDINNNLITGASQIGQVGLEWKVAGFGDFNGDGTTDMMLRNVNTGTFELYDINNNVITSAAAIGQVGLEWQVAGFGPMNGAGTSDMVLRNTNTGAFEVYDLSNNQLTGAASLGQVGNEFQLGGFAADPPTTSTASMGDSSRPTRARDGWIWRQQRRSRQLEYCPTRCRHFTAAVADHTAARMTAPDLRARRLGWR